jgi:hypothetical protein
VDKLVQENPWVGLESHRAAVLRREALDIPGRQGVGLDVDFAGRPVEGEPDSARRIVAISAAKASKDAIVLNASPLS